MFECKQTNLIHAMKSHQTLADRQTCLQNVYHVTIWVMPLLIQTGQINRSIAKAHPLASTNGAFNHYFVLIYQIKNWKKFELWTQLKFHYWIDNNGHQCYKRCSASFGLFKKNGMIKLFSICLCMSRTMNAIINNVKDSESRLPRIHYLEPMKNI